MNIGVCEDINGVEKTVIVKTLDYYLKVHFYQGFISSYCT